MTTGAHSQPLTPALAGVSFLVGNWSAGTGHISETGGTSTGTSTIIPAAGGAILLRRDRTNLFDAAGRASGGFDQLMTIYAEGGAIRADYFDPQHVIHYTNATVLPGRSAVFSTTPAPGVPKFQISYTLNASGTLSVRFAAAPPPGTTLHEIASGTLKKDP